jgi:hypothetical protein
MRSLVIGLCIGIPIGILFFILVGLAMHSPRESPHAFSSFTDPRGIPLDGMQP